MLCGLKRKKKLKKIQVQLKYVVIHYKFHYKNHYISLEIQYVFKIILLFS